jgi:hypothetical protein
MAMPGALPPILLYTLVARSMTVLAECNPYPGNASRIAMDMLIKMQKTDGRQHLQINGFALSTLVSGGFSKLLHHATYRTYRVGTRGTSPSDASLPLECFIHIYIPILSLLCTPYSTYCLL